MSDLPAGFILDAPAVAPPPPAADLPQGFTVDQRPVDTGDIPASGVTDPEGRPVPTWLAQKRKRESTTDPRFRDQSLLKSAGQGVNTGLARLAGAPVDIANLALKGMSAIPSPFKTVNDALGMEEVDRSLPISEKPIGGGDWITEKLANLPADVGGVAVGPMAYQNIEQLPPSHRIAAAATEPIGATIATAGIPFTRAGEAIKKIGPLASKTVDAMRANPGATATGAVAEGIGAGQFGAASEIIAPGSETMRTGAEMVGAVASPLAVVTKWLGRGGRAATEFAQSFTPQGRERAASKIVQEQMRANGVDPAEVATRLEATNPTGLDVSMSGLRSGDPTLLGIEQRLAQENPNFAQRLEAARLKATEQMGQQVEQLRGTGRPADLQQAAKLRDQYFTRVLDERVRRAETAASQSAERLRTNQRDASGISTRADQALASALDDARAAETELWGRVDRGAQVQANSTIAAYDDVRENVLMRAETLPAPVEMEILLLRRAISPEELQATMARLGLPEERISEVLQTYGVGKPPTAGELLRFRSVMLRRAREAGAAGNGSDARIYGQLAEGALDDLAVLPGDAVDDARSFSFALNDTFKRSSAGRLMATDRAGGARVAPEVMLQTAYRGGGTAGQVGFRDLRRATEAGDAARAHLPEQSERRTLPPNAPEMRGAQEDFLRQEASGALNPDGTVNPSRAEAFTRKNQGTLDEFPQVRQDVETAAAAERRRASATETVGRIGQAAEKRAAWSKVLGSEDPANAIGAAVKSANRTAEFRRLSTLAWRSGEPAVAGLRTSAVDWAMAQSRNADNSLNFKKLFATLNTPHDGRGPSLMQLMVQNQVIAPNRARSLNAALKEGIRVQGGGGVALKSGDLNDVGDSIFKDITNAVGAAAGSQFAGAISSRNSLIAASRGSKRFEKWLTKIPRQRIVDVLMALSEDPQRMADALRRTTTPRARDRLLNRFNAAMTQAGLTAEDEEEVPAPGNKP